MKTVALSYRAVRYACASVFIIACMVSLWFLLSNARSIGQPIYLATLTLLTGSALAVRLLVNWPKALRVFFANIMKRKHLILLSMGIILLMGVVLRLYFYITFSYSPVSDPVTFYEAARRIAHGGGMVGNSYVAFFPYLAAYNGILGVAMRLIESPWLAVILLNTVFDVGGAIIAYFLVQKLAKTKSPLPLLAFAMWLLSPFNIVFSVLSLPIVIVNFFIILVIFLIILLLRSNKRGELWAPLGISLATGFALGVGSSFRPVFAVILVAIFVVFICYVLLQKNLKRAGVVFGSAFAVMSITMFAVGSLNSTLVASLTGLTPAKGASGWSIFVGSNGGTNGVWNRADEVLKDEMCGDSISADRERCHNILKDAAIRRYSEHGLVGSASLMIRKLHVFSTNQHHMYNAIDSIDGYDGSLASKLIDICITLFTTLIFALSAVFFYRSARDSVSKAVFSPSALLLALVVVGFFLSAALVEVSERYAQIMYPIFIITAVLSLSSMSRFRNRGVS